LDLAALFITAKSLCWELYTRELKTEMLVASASAALVSPFLSLDLAWNLSGSVLLIFLLLLFQ